MYIEKVSFRTGSFGNRFWMENKMHKNSDKSSTNKFWSCYKKDIILAAAVLAAAVVLLLVYQIQHNSERGESIGGVLEITVDGELYGVYLLNQEQEIDIVSSYGKNTVVIEQNTAYMAQADCPDRICEGMQKISRDGEIICCLPHRLFLTVRGDSAEYDAVAY